jgi:uncharacterized protein YukE
VSGGAFAGFDVVPSVFVAAAGTFDNDAEALLGAAAKLQQALAAIGPRWGDDVVGARFGTAYAPAADRTIQNVVAMSGGLMRIAAALRAVGEAYERSDSVGPGPR